MRHRAWATWGCVRDCGSAGTDGNGRLGTTIRRGGDGKAQGRTTHRRVEIERETVMARYRIVGSFAEEREMAGELVYGNEPAGIGAIILGL